MAAPISLAFNVPFTEAIDWAKNQLTVLPDTFYNELPAQARSRARTVSGLATLDQIDAVLNSLNRAMEDGETFADWKKTLQPEALALGKARLDNIFRTNIQTHYNVGRYQQQEANKAHRPFRMYDAINDGRTRPHHSALDNFIAPIDDPIWRKIYPPNGFRCRCSTLTLTEAQARQRGWNGVPKYRLDGRADEGWDYNPALSQDAMLDKIAAQKLAKANPVVAEKVKDVLDAPPAMPAKSAQLLPEVGPSKSVKDAEKIAETLFAGKGVADYPARDDGTMPVRFKYGKETADETVAKRLGKAKLTGIPVASCDKINRTMGEMQAMCDQIGIPRLRGVRVGSMSMGDGVLNVDKGVVWPDAPWIKKSLFDETGKIPGNSDGYFVNKHFDVVMWHEFGHHIHQTYGVKTVGEYMMPPLERKIVSMFHDKSAVFPTGYSNGNEWEWFAESFALFKNGRRDAIDPRLAAMFDDLMIGNPIL